MSLRHRFLLLKSAADSVSLLRRSLHSSSATISTNGVVTHAAAASELVKPSRNQAFPVDTLALVRALEAKGVPTEQAEAMTSAITRVSNDNFDNVMHLSRMLQETKQLKFESDIKNLQEQQYSMLTRETEKLRTDIDKMASELRTDVDKMRSKVSTDIDKMHTELRYEMDKVTSGSRLDLNLERGRTRDELANQNAEMANLTNKIEREMANLTNKIDREIHTLRAELGAAKYDVIKYCIGTLVSISAVGLAILRLVV